jgi:hypothetical protein
MGKEPDADMSMNLAGDVPTNGHSPSKQFQIEPGALAKSLRKRRMLFGVEGGAVYAGLFDGQTCLVTGEGLADYFDDKDGVGDLRPLVQLFRDVRHREAFMTANRWSDARARWRTDRLDELRSHVESTYGDGGLGLTERDELLTRVLAYRAGQVGTGGLAARHDYLLPARLQFSLDATSVNWTGNALLAVRSPYALPDRHTREATYEFQPRYEEWRLFWTQIGRMGAWGWTAGDPDEPGILDGGYWNFHLAHRGKDLTIGGTTDGHAPRNSRLNRVQRALEQLLDGWPL